MADKKPKPGKAVMDVSRPGKTPPPPNSKAIITGNRPMLKDPMMVEGADNSLAKVSSKAKERLLTAPLLENEEPDATEGAEAAAEPATDAKPAGQPKPADDKPKISKAAGPTQTKKVIVPIDSGTKDGPAKDGPAPEEGPKVEEAEPAKAAKPEVPKTTAVEEKTAPETTPAETAKPDAAEPATDAKPAGQPKPDDAKPTEGKQDNVQTETAEEKETKHQAIIEKLADSKKYYLPINTIEKRRSRHFVVIGVLLSLLLIVAWADIALDAGLIHISGIRPATHFFSN